MGKGAVMKKLFWWAIGLIVLAVLVLGALTAINFFGGDKKQGGAPIPSDHGVVITDSTGIAPAVGDTAKVTGTKADSTAKATATGNKKQPPAVPLYQRAWFVWIAIGCLAGVISLTIWLIVRARRKKARAERIRAMRERFSTDTELTSASTAEETEPKAEKTLNIAPWVFVIIGIGLIILFVFDNDRFATLAWLVAMISARINYVKNHEGCKFFGFNSLFTVAFVTLMLLWIIIYLR
ncbi:hypothetical protein GYA13_04215 [Candidatus Kuenenbacteria bacterium]|nr:hypothetical protein [Candidatus Kuenenbacteria bacterium]